MTAADLDVDPWQVREPRIDVDPDRLAHVKDENLAAGSLGASLEDDGPQPEAGIAAHIDGTQLGLVDAALVSSQRAGAELDHDASPRRRRPRPRRARR